MAQIKVYQDKSPQDSTVESKGSARKKIKKVTSDFFPNWVITVLLSVIWGCFLPPLMGLVAGNLLSGALAGIALVLACMLAVLVFDTYTPGWRTIGWSIFLSSLLVLLCTKIPDFPGKLLVIIIPIGLFVSLRVNMNARKLFIHR